MSTELNTSEITLPFCVSLLVNDLTHRDKAVREAAEEQIVRIGKEAIPPIMDTFETEPSNA